MLGDAVLAEILKLSRDNRLLFWGFLVVPCGYLAVQLVVMIFFRVTVAVDLGAGDGLRSLIGAFGLGQNLFAEAFFIGGAAGLLAGDYRWETWRSIVPRNNRRLLIAAKLLLFVFVAAVCLLLVGVADVLLGVGEALLWRHPLPRFEGLGAAAIPLATAFVASLLKVAVLGSLAALCAVVTRSTVATLGTVAMAAVVETLAAHTLAEDLSTHPRLLALPSMATNALLGWANQGAGGAVSNATALMGLIALLTGVVLPALAAVAIFARQDLARE